MVPFGTVILQTSAALGKEGIADARLEAELLLGHVLRIPRHELLASYERTLTADQAEALGQLVKRRKHREPLAYLIGRKEFYGLEFAISPAVLIPRPETELLVEQALSCASARAGDVSDLVIAEPGTGSGAVSIVLAKELPTARVYATDLCQDALRIANLNVISHCVSSTVTLLQGNLLEPIPERADIIVANLPYVMSGDIAGLQAEVQWEPRDALDGGPDGLDVIRSLLLQAPEKLKNNGTILLEIDPHQTGPLEILARETFPAASTTVLQDFSNLDRIFIADSS